MRLIVVMGVSGSGKSTIGAAAAKALTRRGTPALYLDGDHFHSAGNIAKMARGEPLTDADRWPWLDRVGAEMAAHEGVVLGGCSALRRAYRDRLRAAVQKAAGAPLGFLHLTGEKALIQARMSERAGHFMPASLLDSQFAILEPPGADETAVTIDIDQPIGRITDIFLNWYSSSKSAPDTFLSPQGGTKSGGAQDSGTFSGKSTPSAELSTTPDVSGVKHTSDAPAVLHSDSRAVLHKKPPTMAEIAAIVGVSTMTVSRAFKPSSSVNEATRARIREVAEELGYVLDVTASNLSSRKTGFVAVTIPTINNGNFADTIRGLTEGLAARLEGTGLQILLGYTDYCVEKEEELVEQFLRRRPEAIVVTGGTHTARCRRIMENAGVPVVEIWDRPDDPIGHVAGFSNADAGRLMARHLCGEGYQQIAFIGSATDRDRRGIDRRRGFFEALQAEGRAGDRFIEIGEPPIAMGEAAEAFDKLLARWPDTEAIMCVSDPTAFGVLSAARARGLSVPGDIAIAGFGAYDLAEYSDPPMTTIHVSPREIGRAAAKLIVEDLTEAWRGGPRVVGVEPVLIQRMSTLRQL